MSVHKILLLEEQQRLCSGLCNTCGHRTTVLVQVHQKGKCFYRCFTHLDWLIASSLLARIVNCNNRKFLFPYPNVNAVLVRKSEVNQLIVDPKWILRVGRPTKIDFLLLSYGFLCFLHTALCM